MCALDAGLYPVIHEFVGCDVARCVLDGKHRLHVLAFGQKVECLAHEVAGELVELRRHSLLSCHSTNPSASISGVSLPDPF